MARTGRPKAEVVKSKIITMRVTDEEYEIMRQYATAHSMTMTQVLLEGFYSLADQES